MKNREKQVIFMSGFEEKERVWEQMAEAAKRRKQRLHTDESEEKAAEKEALDG